MGVAFLTAVAVAIFGAIFRSEYEAWTPWLAERIRRMAVCLLRDPLRERLDEEWQAYLTDVPGNVGKVFCAIGFCFAAGLIQAGKTFRGIACQTLDQVGTNAFKLSGAISKCERSLDRGAYSRLYGPRVRKALGFLKVRLTLLYFLSMILKTKFVDQEERERIVSFVENVARALLDATDALENNRKYSITVTL